jgi:hypothetical protein
MGPQASGRSSLPLALWIHNPPEFTMKTAWVLLGVLVAGVGSRVSAEEPNREAWVTVWTDLGCWAIRVDGGPVKQVATDLPPFDGGKWKAVPGLQASGVLAPDGKHLLYTEEAPNVGKKPGEERHRVVIADADGKNPKQVLTGLKVNQGCRVSPDGTTVVCGAEQDGKWHLYRVPFDGSAPVKLSQTSGIDSPVFRILADGRYLYRPTTGHHIEKVEIGTFTKSKGPAILIDGKKETVLIKETTSFPEITLDATKMAQSGKNEKGEEVIEITDLKTQKKEEIPLKAFNKDWTCQFRSLKFSPDGKSLAVTFFLGNVVFRQKGPLPGDDAVEHVGVVWLDGRKDRTLFRVDQPAEKGGHFASIEGFAWSSAPAAKK